MQLQEFDWLCGHGIFNNYSTCARWIYEIIIANWARSDELAIMISYPTSASGIIALLKQSRNIARSC